MLEVMNSDYVRLARAKGLSRRQVMVKHALRTALIPLTTVTALDIATIIGGAVDHRDRVPVAGDGRLPARRRSRSDDVYAVMAWLLVTGHRGDRVQPDRRPALRRSRPQDPLCLNTACLETRRPRPEAPVTAPAAGPGAPATEPRVHRRRAQPVAARVPPVPAAPVGVGSLVVFVLLVLLAYVGGALWQYDVGEITPDNSAPPSLDHPFGTDAVGQGPVRPGAARHPDLAAGRRARRVPGDARRHAVGRDRRLLRRARRHDHDAHLPTSSSRCRCSRSPRCSRTTSAAPGA